MTTQTITVRASAWGKLFDCAYRFEWENLLRNSKPAGLRALLGSAVHKGTAVFDQGRLDNSGITPDDAAGALVDTLRSPGFDVDYTQDELTVREAERIALTLHTKYCIEISPQFDFLAVECQLDPLEIDCGNGVEVRLTGTMDRARAAQTEAGPVIPDIKTGTRVMEKGAANVRGRSAQLGTYQLMYEATEGVRTAGAQVVALATTSKPDAAVSPIFDARRVMVGTDDQPGLIQHAAEMFRSGLFPPNPSSPLCSPKYCARWKHCIFHE